MMMNGCCMKMSGLKVDQKSGDVAMSIASAMSDGVLYSIPKRRRNIVDMVLKIIDGDGPKPMKNMRPAQKIRTGADQFYDDHHGAYEARGEPSRDKIGRVNTHNSAFPKMYDELKKRRSMARPTANSYMSTANIPMATDYDENCRICMNLKNKSDLESRKKRICKRPRQRKNNRRCSNSTRNTGSRITKVKKPRRSQSPSKVIKLSKIRTNKCCQCTTYYIPTAAESKSVSTFDDDFASMPQQDATVPLAPTVGSHDSVLESNSVKIAVQNKESKKSDVDSGNPETNSPSVSSYNSFMSMEHEPMVE